MVTLRNHCNHCESHEFVLTCQPIALDTPHPPPTALTNTARLRTCTYEFFSLLILPIYETQANGKVWPMPLIRTPKVKESYSSVIVDDFFIIRAFTFLLQYEARILLGIAKPL